MRAQGHLADNSTSTFEFSFLSIFNTGKSTCVPASSKSRHLEPRSLVGKWVFMPWALLFLFFKLQCYQNHTCTHTQHTRTHNTQHTHTPLHWSHQEQIQKHLVSLLTPWRGSTPKYMCIFTFIKNAFVCSLQQERGNFNLLMSL